MLSLKEKTAKNYINFRGWSTKRKIVVIESDDWGSVRMADQSVYNELHEKYPQITKHRYLVYDGLERKRDLESLFEMLTKHKDSKGKPPVVTALSLTSNPDFKKIRETDNYHSETIKETYDRYDETDLLSFWKEEGIKNNLLYPQFHGKEHLFPERYFKRVKDSNDLEHVGFNHDSVFGVDNFTREKNFLAAFEYHNESDKKLIEKRTAEGLKEFKEIFGFNSISFCPSQSVYGNHLFDVLKNNGVLAIQAGQQFYPEDMKLKKKNHLWGDKTKNGIVFWRRNCTFEPGRSKNSDYVDKCLKEIEIAFRWGKPAVINSHRINYTSRITTDLRDRTLNDLNNMLTTIIKKWPEVEFMNSEQLAKTLLEDK
ncbi:hypothetical protein [Brumimicrobium mesophilum]|uniref:hypothetical protein n=1 Tax=Brumimicrobium mesophilum TaxID=392717 RepID=UPI000D13EC98|nr:hypothetical protein [Brumimicrobium mesophilum]